MKPRLQSRRGFTLVEVMLSATLAAMALAAVMSCFVFLARNFTRLANAQGLERQGRTTLAYLQADLDLALGVKTGTTPTSMTLTLKLPAGDVTYTYDSSGQRLRRQAGFGASPDLYLLGATGGRCTSFAFTYFTGSNGSPLDQLSGTTNTALSIKQVQARFLLETPAGEISQTQMSYTGISPRLHLQNKRKPDGN
jgi:prepilin-type N-terminal cleavage/methylation domain-containing protein